MRKKGSYEYKEEHEELLYRIINNEPKTTNAITKEFKRVFLKVDFNTVKRLLNNLYKNGRIKKIKLGKILIWNR